MSQADDTSKFSGGAASLSLPAPEVIYVSTRRVVCDGGGGALGHPKVWYDIGDDNVTICGYCDRRFVFDPEKASS